MREKLLTLYKIQQTDTKIDRIYLLRGELPLEVKDLEDEVEGLKTRIANTTADIKAAENSLVEFRAHIDECQHLIAKYEEQRDNVKNNREYESICKEIEYQQLDQESFEKKIRETNLMIADKKNLLEETKNFMQGRELDLEEKRKELDQIVEETAKEEAALIKEKEELASKIDERMLVAYGKVRGNAKNHLAVVTVKRGACGGCFNQIPPQRQLDIAQSKKVIVCEYCGRILVDSEFENE
ncbi:MAG: hypothetical protein IJS02_05270 [Bacteroidales bacterium]|nr:hypothetical protein [Bacteroidales bacterium]